MRDLLTRRRGPLTTLMVVLVIVLALDLAGTAVSYVTHKGDPPHLPDLEHTAGAVRGGVDPYELPAASYGFSTEATGNLEISDDGRVRRAVGDEALFDPDASLRYALAALDRDAEEPGQGWDAKAATSVREVLEHSRDGFAVHEIPTQDAKGNPIPAGWVSGQTQGLLLSALVRLHATTGEPRWRRASNRVFDTFLPFRNVADENGDKPTTWVSMLDKGDYLWFEELPQSAEPSFYVTGHVAALFGLYDYWKTARGGRKVVAEQLISAGASTAAMAASSARLPYYAARSGLSGSEDRDGGRHRVLAAQLKSLQEMVRDRDLRRLARLYPRDIDLAEFVATNLFPVGDVDAYATRRVTSVLPPTEILPTRTTSPDVAATRALDDLAEYSRTGSRAALRRAEVAVDQLLKSGTDGFVPHRETTKDLNGWRVNAPWYSAQTQGLVLSALTRLSEATGEPRWQQAADQVFATFEHFRGGQGSHQDDQGRWISAVGDANGYGSLWFEAFARPKDQANSPSYIMTSHLAGPHGHLRLLAPHRRLARTAPVQRWRLDRPQERRLPDGAREAAQALADVRLPEQGARADNGRAARAARADDR